MMTPYGNPYIAQINPQQQQELGGLMPVFQNIGQQQAMQNAALAQQNQLVSQAGQTAQSGGMNPLAMAMLLRKGKEDPYAKNQGNPYLNAQTAMNMYGAENVYGFGGQGQVPTTTTGMD
jgi:hypothetical protein